VTTVKATLIGGPTLVLRYAGLTFLTDPTFDPPGTYGNLTKVTGPAMALEDLGHVDAVLLSHDQHEDNLDAAGRTLLSRVRHVLSTPHAGERLDKVQGMRRWETAILPGGDADVTITAVPARHGPRVVKQVMGQVTGFVLQAEGWPTVYISGDNSSVKKARKVAEAFPDVDVAVLFAGAARIERLGDMLLTMDAERCARVAALWPRAAIAAIHVDGWAHFTEPMDDLRTAFAEHAPEEQLVVLERGIEHALA
jgi:L-ascorbate metabolism protein UlaG (beta-lactamase superfamily)